MSDETYVSSDDSQALREVLLAERGKSFIEIGIGYGSNLKSVSKNFELVVGTDIRKTEAFEILKSTGIELVLTDKASCFRPSTFQVAAMNPPYLPSEEIEDLATDGGNGGFDIPRLFLESAMRVLEPEGKALILLSSETDLKQFKDYCDRNSIKFKALLEKNLFFETLFVFELRRTSNIESRLS